MKKLQSTLAKDRRSTDRRSLRAALEKEQQQRAADAPDRRKSRERRGGNRVDVNLAGLAGSQRLLVANISPSGFLLKSGSIDAAGTLVAVALPDGKPPIVVRASPTAAGGKRCSIEVSPQAKARLEKFVASLKQARLRQAVKKVVTSAKGAKDAKPVPPASQEN